MHLKGSKSNVGGVEGGRGWDINYVISCIKFSRKKSRNISKKYTPSSWKEKGENKKWGRQREGISMIKKLYTCIKCQYETLHI